MSTIENRLAAVVFGVFTPNDGLPAVVDQQMGGSDVVLGAPDLLLDADDVAEAEGTEYRMKNSA